MKEGVISLGNAHAGIDTERRGDIMRNHSSVHLLQAALRKVLGSHVEQAGSYVDDKRARFDFTHFAAMTTEEINEAERLVNEEILKGEAITIKEMPIAEAKAEGAMALFGEKYGDIVRVVKMGGFSTELCGGTHLSNTAKAGLFKIVSEASVAAGVRRIEAITGRNTLEYLNHNEQLLQNLKTVIKANNISDITEKAQSLQDEIKRTKKELENANLTLAMAQIEKAYADAKEIGSVKLVSCRFNELPADSLRLASDRLIDKNSSAVCVFATVNEGKVLFVAGCGKAALSVGAHAGNLLKAISPIVGGGGGGRPDSATSGGKDASKLDEAIAAADDVLEKQINK
jgi:alanyl-tRNA synthetase